MYRSSSVLACVMLAAGCGDEPSARATSDTLDAQIEITVRTLDAASGSPLPAWVSDASALDAGDAGSALDSAIAFDATVDAAVDATVETVDAMTAAVPEDCDLTGKWALGLRANVSSTTTQFSNSSGEARAWLVLDVQGTAGSFSASSRVCGAEFPPVVLRPELAAESYRMQFPRGGTGLPGGTLTLRSKGERVELDTFAVLLGVKTDFDASDPWPADGKNAEVDSDLDRKAGVTVTWSTTDGQQLPPVDIEKTARARDSQLTARVVIAATQLSGCDAWDGDTGSARIESHALGCTLSSGGGCNGEQTDILEIIRPQYTAQTAKLKAVRLPTDANCDAALEALD